MTHSVTPPAESNRVAPLKVTPFEDKLLRNVRLILTPPALSPTSIEASPSTRSWYYHQPAPLSLSDNARTLLQRLLAQGTVLFLVRVNGGWRESFLRQGEEVTGRLWERHPLSERALHFSGTTLNWLHWLTSLNPALERQMASCPTSDSANSTPVDEFVLWRILDTVCFLHSAAAPSFQLLAELAAFRNNPWVWLTSPHLMPQINHLGMQAPGNEAAADEAVVTPLVPDFTPCFEGWRAFLLEALQEHLYQRWLMTIPRRVTEAKQTQRLQQFYWSNLAIAAVFRRFLGAAEAARRPDLAVFLLRLLAQLHQRLPEASDWWHNLGEENLPQWRQRQALRRAAVAVPLLTFIFHSWTRYYQQTSFLDEDYRIGQWWLREWDRYRGDDMVAWAQRLLTLLEPFSPRSDS
ncbi:MAG: hypothetical protein NZ703_06190 [Gemmataceae bacterium]|nr:hypothetical protein [Gemmataceae bacterium]MDW8243653.1 hypothetical protein [Thermogemmata sp.]